MKLSRFRMITFLALSLFVLVAVVAFGSWYAPFLGDAGIRLQHYLFQPLFQLGGLPITFFFLLKTAIFLVALTLASHFTMLVLQKRVLTHVPLAIGQQYAVARVVSYLVFVLGLIIGLQSLGLNLSSLVVVGGALGIGVGLGLQAIVSNFVAGLILLLEQPIKLGDRIEVGNTYGDVVRLRGRSTWIQTNDNVVIIVPNSEFINQRVTNWTANDRQVRISLPVGVSYDSDPKGVREVLLAVAKGHPDVLPDPSSEVIFVGLGDSSLNFELRVWTIQQVQTPARLRSDLYFAIFDAFRKENIEMPFPQRDLHVRSIAEPLAATFLGRAPHPLRSGPGE
jgi:small-conductance mechanosensitive channel